MKHLRKFNEEILPRDKDGNPAEVLDADGNKTEFIKEYLSGVIDNFSDKEFIEDYYNLD
jgi:hypothetical protein